ncbi:MAG TPA: tripartite tricarboxylate transporter substrate binding protein [Burkholderiales bacterium]|nr:tripartite tricarboxylate transporter substrate binding protein [Burkholderiales bacterium]
MKRSFLRVVALAAACGFAGTATGQPYPSRPVRIIVASSAGGGSDFVARLIGNKLAEPLGQQVIVDNRGGGGGTIGVELGVRAAPDGYTLTLITPTYAINPALYPIKFDPLSDFTPVIPVARGPYVIVVHPSLPVRNVKELIALAKAKPGQITYGTSGTGAIVHLTTELFLYMAGIKMAHVPYKGGGPALSDLIAGHIQLVFATSQTGLVQAKAGRLRALAVTTPYRISAEPDLPTVAEAGVPGYEVTNWHGLIGPKGLPRPVVERLNGELNRILKTKEMEDRLQSDGVSPAGGTPEQLYEVIRKELVQWAGVVKRAGVKLN